MPGPRLLPRSDREVAVALLKRLARHEPGQFCLCTVYDEDMEFLCALAADLGAPRVDAHYLVRRLRRVCQRLQAAGVLGGRVRSCHREYLGEPKTLKRYEFTNPGYAARLAPDRHPWYTPLGSVDGEVDFLLRWAYPRKDSSRGG